MDTCISISQNKNYDFGQIVSYNKYIIKLKMHSFSQEINI